jgi:hypothetical protein
MSRQETWQQRKLREAAERERKVREKKEIYFEEGDPDRPSKTTRLGHGKSHGQHGLPEEQRRKKEGWRARRWKKKWRGNLPKDR